MIHAIDPYQRHAAPIENRTDTFLQHLRFQFDAKSLGHNHVYRILIILTLASLWGSILYSDASAQTSGDISSHDVISDTVPVRRTNWTDTLTLPQFDPARGILTQIELILAGEVNGSVRIENLDAAAATITAESISDIVLERPDGTFITMATPNSARSVTLTAFDGTVDFAGSSGTFLEDMVGIDISERTVYTAFNDLEPFVGSGSIELAVGATGRSRATGAGNLGLSFSTMAGAAITVTYVYTQPAIMLEKATNGEDADQLPGPSLLLGAPVIWTYVVTNIGGTPLEDITLVDDQEGNVTATCPQTTLALGESMICEVTGIVQRGQYTNTAVVTGQVPDDMPGLPRSVTAEDPSHYTGVGEPAIALEKATNGEDADQLPGPLVAAGDVVTWTYVVHNIGDILLENITLVDDQEGNISASCPQSQLAADETMTCTVTGIAIQGQYTNTAVVTGTTPSDSIRPNVPVTAEDPSHYTGTTVQLCPVDGDGNVILPALRYLGEGVGVYDVDTDEIFVIKKFSPFRFVNEATAFYESTKRTGAPERVWACSGECAFTRGLEESIDLGFLPVDTALHIVVLDDDPDERINLLLANKEIASPVIRFTEQSLTEEWRVQLPLSAEWQFYADDSIGLYLCVQ